MQIIWTKCQKIVYSVLFLYRDREGWFVLVGQTKFGFCNPGCAAVLSNSPFPPSVPSRSPPPHLCPLRHACIPRSKALIIRRGTDQVFIQIHLLCWWEESNLWVSIWALRTIWTNFVQDNVMSLASKRHVNCPYTYPLLSSLVPFYYLISFTFVMSCGNIFILTQYMVFRINHANISCLTS